MRNNEVRSVSTAFEVLELLARSEESLGVTEIANELGITKTRGYRHLRTLVRGGYATQDPRTEKYRAGVKLFLLGQKVGERHDLLSAARKVMRPLRDEVGHTVTVSQVGRDGVVVLDMVRGSSPMDIGTKPGSVFPLHCSAQGKVALAFGDPAFLEQVKKRPMKRMAPGTSTSPAKLLREVRSTRERGWAVAPEEILLGVNALAAPIFFADENLAGTIALVDSVQVLPPLPRKRQIDALLRAARIASLELGDSKP